MIPYVNAPGANVKQAKIFTAAASKYAPGAGTSAVSVPGVSATVGARDAATPPPATSTPAVDPNFFLNAINSDPLYGQDKTDAAANSVQDSQSAAANIVRSLVQRGIVPDMASAASSLGLSQNVLDFLKNNVDLGHASALAKQATDSGVSQEARLALTHNQNVQGVKNSLAARGLAASGASASDLGREANQYKVQKFDADQQTADYINGAIAAFAQSERQRQDSLRQSAAAAAARQQQLFAGASPPTVATPAASAPTDVSSDAYLRDLLARATKTHTAIAA